jgi:hypothetical protein
MSRITAALALCLFGAVAVAGCASRENTEPKLQAKLTSPTAVCRGYVAAFGDIPFQTSWLNCGTEKFYVAWAEKVTDRFSPCAFAFEPPTDGKGVGTMACNNDSVGPLTYDRTDEDNIKVAAKLDHDREMIFTMRVDRSL